MYKIIGSDGQQYGPVTLEQLRQWITEGRVNAQTQVQAEGSADWKPLGQFPELAALLGVTMPPPPVVGAVNPEQLAAEILARDYRIEIGSCISRSWQLLKANFWLLVGTTLVCMAIASASVVGLILGGPMMGGLYLLYLKLIRGQPATFGDAFAGFTAAFVQLMLAYIVSQVLGAIGLALCIIPGIYLSVAWLFALILTADKKIEFWPAMELSRKVVTHHWWTIFGLVLLAGLVGVLGVLACGIGIFATLPIAFGAIAYAYEDIFGEKSTPAA